MEYIQINKGNIRHIDAYPTVVKLFTLRLACSAFLPYDIMLEIIIALCESCPEVHHAI
jgi:hypothetical protein